MASKISEERKSLYNAGLVVIIIGVCLFALPFISILFTMSSGNPSQHITKVPIAFIGAFIGFVLIAIGRGMRTLAAKGKAGSGLILDPEQARKDIEPWSRMSGGVIKDTLDEAGVNLGQVTKQLANGTASQPGKNIMVRCLNCKKLNEEDSKFCQQCGKPI